MNLKNMDQVMLDIEQLDYLALSLHLMVQGERFKEAAIGVELVRERLEWLRVHLEAAGNPKQ